MKAPTILCIRHGADAGASLRLPAAIASIALAACAATTGDTAAWPLEGTYWRLSALHGQPVAPQAGTREAHLVLEQAARRASGYAGCNRFTGAYTLYGAALRFAPPAATRMACIDGMDREQAFLTALGAAAAWRVDGQRLQLLDAGRQVVAEFVSGSERYVCDGEKPLFVHHDNADPARPQALLWFEGRSYRLRGAPTGSGARYVTEQGRSTDMSLEWLSKGGEGTVAEAPLSDTRKESDLKTVARCSRRSDAVP